MIAPARNHGKIKSPNQIILVAGGASFLGAHLCRSLIGQDCLVYCVDDLTAQKKRQIEDLLEKDNFYFLEHDIVQPLPAGLPKFSHILHLSGIEEYLLGRDLSFETLIINSQGTKNLLDRTKTDGAKFLLVSSLEVYSGVLSASHLKHYFGTGEQVYRHYSHHEAKRYAEALTVTYFERFGIDARIARVVDVYGPLMPLETGSTIARLLKEALEGNDLTIAGEGLDILYPTYVADVVYGLLKAIFGDQTSGGIFNLVNLEEVTVLNFAYALKDVLGRLDSTKNLQLHFADSELMLKFPLPKKELFQSQTDLGWVPKTKLEEGLKLTLESFLLKKEPVKEEKAVEAVAFPLSVEQPKPTTKEKLSVFLERWKRQLAAYQSWLRLPSWSMPQMKLRLGIKKATMVFVALFLFVFLLLPFIQIIGGGLLGSRTLFSLKDTYQNDLKTVEKSAKKADFLFRNAHSGLNQLGWLFWLTGQSKRKNNWHRLLQAGSDVSEAVLEVVSASTTMKSLLAAVLEKSGDINIEEDILETNIRLGKASQLLGLASAQLFLPEEKHSFLVGDLSAQREVILSAKRRIDLAIAGLQLLPTILGRGGERNYLLLFQNNNELRPTGGFIGSYGVLTLSNGYLQQVTIDDVYNLDGQIKEQIEPPSPLKRALGVSSWGLRDSNWDPDFARSAKVANGFYAKVFPNKIDGVFAFDQTAIANLLAVLGPVELDNYSETISEKNLADRAQYYSEIGFFPGSTAKKDFLGAVATKIMDRLKNRTIEKNWPKIFTAVANSLVEKHILIYFNNPAAESLVALENWTGEIKAIPYDKETSTFLSDYLSVIEANVGANKSNRFLERSITLNPVIQRDGDVISGLTLEYANRSPADTWPGGIYKSYLRIYLPLGVKLESIDNGNNKDLGQVEIVRDRDKEIWGFFVEVGVGEKKKVVLKYRTPYRIKIEGNSAFYSLLVQKQAGTEKDSFVINLSFPAYLKPTNTNLPSEQSTEQTLTIKTNLDQDKTITAAFSF